MEAILNTETKQHLTFKLGDEHYAVNVGNVQEILECLPITRMPNTSAFMRGIVNVRGHVVPVIDLRLKFGMKRTEETVNTCIIVMEIVTEEQKTRIGVLADSVEEVIDFGAEQIEPPPKMGTAIDTEFILGIGKHEGAFTMILDVRRMFSGEEIAQIQQIGV